jgi:long-chain acyl-CoA synthetase
VLPQGLETIPEVFSRILERFGPEVAARWTENGGFESITYAQLGRRVDRLTRVLVGRGLSGLRIGIVGPATVEWITAFFAIAASGNAAVPLDKDLDSETALALARQARLEGFFIDPGSGGAARGLLDGLPCARACFGLAPGAGLEDIPALVGYGTGGGHGEEAAVPEAGGPPEAPPVAPESTALLAFTSGTTGWPKLVELTHRNLTHDLYCSVAVLGQKVAPGSQTLLALPPHHVFGITVTLLTSLWDGATVCMGSDRRRQAGDVTRFKPDIIVVPPRFVDVLHRRIWAQARLEGREGRLRRALALSRALRRVGIDARRRLLRPVIEGMGGNLRYLIAGGGPLRLELIREFDELGVTVLNGYGVTECSPVVACNGIGRNVPGSVGQPGPAPYCEVRCRDGEIQVRGSIVMKGYFDDPAGTAAAMDGDWLRTGDLGRLDAEGNLYVTGRQPNQIALENGQTVLPEEIEVRLEAHPAISSALVRAVHVDGKTVLGTLVHPALDLIAAVGAPDPFKAVATAVREVNSTLPAHHRLRVVDHAQTDFQRTDVGQPKRYLYS